MKVNDFLCGGDGDSARISDADDGVGSLDCTDSSVVSVNVYVVNTFLTKYVQLCYLPCIKQFGLPVSVRRPVYTNDHRVSPCGVSLQGMYICFVSSE